jgi:hypothetical protein
VAHGCLFIVRRVSFVVYVEADDLTWERAAGVASEAGL